MIKNSLIGVNMDLTNLYKESILVVWNNENHIGIIWVED